MRYTPIKIRAACLAKGYSLSRLALSSGLPEAACRVALYRVHQPGEQAIADLLGVHPQVIWPGRYYPDGTHRSPRIQRRQNAAASPESHGKKEKAA